MAAAASGRKTGSCKWFNSKKGFGFITPSDGSEDVFVHQSAIKAEGFRSLAEKEPVEYDTVLDENGRVKAANVTGPQGGYVQGAPKPRYLSRDAGSPQGGEGGGYASRPRGRGGFGGGRGGSGGGFRTRGQSSATGNSGGMEQ